MSGGRYCWVTDWQSSQRRPQKGQLRPCARACGAVFSAAVQAHMTTLLTIDSQQRPASACVMPCLDNSVYRACPPKGPRFGLTFTLPSGYAFSLLPQCFTVTVSVSIFVWLFQEEFLILWLHSLLLRNMQTLSVFFRQFSCKLRTCPSLSLNDSKLFVYRRTTFYPRFGSIDPCAHCLLSIRSPMWCYHWTLVFTQSSRISQRTEYCNV